IFQFGSVISVNTILGTPVASADPVGAFQYNFLASSITGIDVESGDGDDTIRVDRFADYSAIPITVNGGGGHDTLICNGLGSDYAHPVDVRRNSVTGGYTNI